MPRIYIPDNIPRDPPPLPFEVKRFGISENIALDKDAPALVLRWMPAARIKAIAEQLPNLRWLQMLVAGVDQALAADLPAHVQICKGIGIHEAPTAELAVALLLSGIRGMHVFRDNQKKNVWDEKYYGFQLNPPQPYLGTLEGAKVVILGMGVIGQEIAKRLVPFGAHIEGVAQTAGIREGFTVHAAENMLDVVAKADAVIAVLPETSDTRAMINEDFFKHMQKHAWFVNVGRGTAVDEKALFKALAEKWITGGAIDVTEREPLPKDSPLWGLDNLIITPHVAGGGPKFYEKAMKLVADNAKRFMAGEPLLHVIDRSRGY
jgi:phosphoglycerate dehydrogenase-like enzyme